MRKGTTKNINWGNHCTGQHSNRWTNIGFEVLLAVTQRVLGSGGGTEKQCRNLLNFRRELLSPFSGLSSRLLRNKSKFLPEYRILQIQRYNDQSNDTAAQKQVICAVYVYNSIHQPISNKQGTCLAHELPHLG
jgi:hypothetical protein